MNYNTIEHKRILNKITMPRQIDVSKIFAEKYKLCFEHSWKISSF
jgi:hypothetical protein